MALNSTDARVLQVALSDYVGDAQMVTDSIDEPGVGSPELSPDHADGCIRVDVTTGDTLVESGNVPSPDVIKIDVEGAELNVLRGLEDTLSSRDCRVVYCEVHGDTNQNLSRRVGEMLRECGFAVDLVSVGRWGHHLRGMRESRG